MVRVPGPIWPSTKSRNWPSKGVGLDATTFFDTISQPEIKQKLRDNTDELIERGGYGSPTMFVDGDDMNFGNDRLPLVRGALLARRETS